MPRQLDSIIFEGDWSCKPKGFDINIYMYNISKPSQTVIIGRTFNRGDSSAKVIEGLQSMIDRIKEEDDTED